jgi:hypothetical protein
MEVASSRGLTEIMGSGFSTTEGSTGWLSKCYWICDGVLGNGSAGV